MKLSDVMHLTRGPEKLRPCLVGHTGAGKTAKVRQAAEELGLPVHTMLLSHEMPETVSGIPRPGNAKSTCYHVIPPEWVPRLAREPHVLFLDELDKAREDTIGAVLTLLWSLDVGPHTLHPDTVIVAAMQPTPPGQFLASETGKALAARLIFRDCGYDWDFVSSATGVDLTDLPMPAAPELPINPYPSPRQVTECINLLDVMRKSGLVEDFLDEKDKPRPDVLRTIMGVLPEEIAETVIRRFVEHDNSLDPVNIARAVCDEPELIDRLTVQELVSLVGPLANKGTPEAWSRAIIKVALEGSEEDMERWFQDQFDYLNALADKDPDNEVDFLGDATEREIENMLQRTAKTIGDGWIARNKGGR